jgi:hypothetical protein
VVLLVCRTVGDVGVGRVWMVVVVRVGGGVGTTTVGVEEEVLVEESSGEPSRCVVKEGEGVGVSSSKSL